MTQTGKCQCGAIRYSVDGEPAHSSLCWCSDCRASSGAPMVQWTLFPREAVTIEGSPARYESSTGTYRDFCGTCGTGMFYTNESIFPGQIDIQGATFDNPDAFAPQAHIQLADAPRWGGQVGDLPRFDRFPPMPE